MLISLLFACSDRLAISGPVNLDDFVGFIDDHRLEIAEGGRGDRVRVALDLDCGECFEVTADGRDITVHAGDVRGAQYGVAAVLEAYGYRFNHPFDTVIPEGLSRGELPEGVQEPDLERRGLHLHTLHPIEGLEAFWMPSDSDERARRVIDWTIKNRGNHLQWVALDDILVDPAPWQDWTGQINAYAHERGLTTGLGIQLYGSSNLQKAYDLVDDPEGDTKAQIDERLDIVTTGTDFDLYNLSFGEFFGEDPEAFVADVDLVYTELRARTDAEMSTVIHVGDDQRVTYDGKEMIYYFLALYADPEVTPWIHSVMFYNLFEPAGGAYHHEEFTEHREALLERIAAGKPVAYFPESAYWVAFDNSVPQWFPLYVRSRWLDLASTPGLKEHVLFSSGWEWGYWQNDVATLRMCWEIPDNPDDIWTFMLGGDVGAAAVEVVEIQHAALIEGGLTPWITSRDNTMELGYQLGIISQPARPDFDALGDPEALRAEVIEPLRQYAEDLRAVPPLPLFSGQFGPPERDPWKVEVEDGLAIDILRADYMAALLEGIVGDGDFSKAEALLEQAQAVVDSRSLHDPERELWVDTDWDNPTIYDYGYLGNTTELCFWRRELAQARNARGAAEPVPGCSLSPEM